MQFRWQMCALQCACRAPRGPLSSGAPLLGQGCWMDCSDSTWRRGASASSDKRASRCPALTIGGRQRVAQQLFQRLDGQQ